MTVWAVGFPEVILQDLACFLDAKSMSATQLRQETLCDYADIYLLDASQEELQLWAAYARQQALCVVMAGRAHDKTACTALTDFFITTPFHIDELQAIINPLLHRQPPLRLGHGWFCDIYKRTLSHASRPSIELTDKETELLRALYEARPQMISKAQLLERVWGYGAAVDTNTLETHIYRLRSKCAQMQPSDVQLLSGPAGYALSVASS